MLQNFLEDTKTDFTGKHKIFFVLSTMLVIASVFLLFVKGLNFGIDFTGGTLVEIKVETKPNLAELRDDLSALNLGDIQIQEFGSPVDLLIRMPEQSGTPADRKQAIETLQNEIDNHFEEEVDYRRIEFVGPQVGKELRMQGLYAILFSLLGIMAYIWFRFEWQFGVAAIIALAHDSILTIGLFSFAGWQFDLSTVAAVLMIAGYSINDTVVVFDRVRENLRKYKKKPAYELFNMSINQVLRRSLITSLTTLIALISLWVFGGEVIRGFVNALIAGIVIGTYSSIFIATPALLYLNVRRDRVSDGN